MPTNNDPERSGATGEARPQVSERRRAANRANAQKSSGPCTDQGKERVTLNLPKTGLENGDRISQYGPPRSHA